uniref:Uncharacterized protein n=1 Tax=Anguilla anguilla TaxID=7936 RepID=A0A0E9WMZ7_ANGAN
METLDLLILITNPDPCTTFILFFCVKFFSNFWNPGLEDLD